MHEMQNMKKEEPIYIFGSFKGYPKGGLVSESFSLWLKSQKKK
jgi:hypothetical protein